MQVGSTVNVSGQFSATVNNGGPGQFVALKIALPVSSSFTNRCQVAGTAVSNCNYVFDADGVYTGIFQALYGRIYAYPGQDYAVIEFEQIYGGDGNAQNIEMSYHFTYTVI